MSVTTPSTGQKISDFSAGNVDANSYFIQANSGSTSKVSASQIGQFSNLNLLFSELDTSSKSTIGAINEIKANEASDIADVQAAIDAINSTTAPLFYLGTYTYTTASVAANRSITISKNNFGITDIDGYTPISMPRISVSKAGFVLTTFNATGVNTVLGVMNNTSDAIENTTFTITIIYVKSDFLQDLA